MQAQEIQDLPTRSRLTSRDSKDPLHGTSSRALRPVKHSCKIFRGFLGADFAWGILAHVGHADLPSCSHNAVPPSRVKLTVIMKPRSADIVVIDTLRSR